MSREVFDPETWLKQNLPKGFRNKLLTGKMTLKRGVLQSLILSSAIKKKPLNALILKTVDNYVKKMQDLKQEGDKKALSHATNKEKLLKSRVENYLVYEESQRLKEENLGKKYVWLPSSSKVPRPSHQAKYGKTYTAGKGEFPGEAYGCKCGFMFLE